jgi:hypothetical protein
MRPIGSLDRGGARLREPQPLTAAGTRHVRRLARLQPTPLRPPLKAPHRGRDLAQACDHDPLEVLPPTLPPLIHPPRLKPTHADQHIGRRHELTLRQRRLRGRTTRCSSLFPFPALTPAQTTPTTSPTPTSSRRPRDPWDIGSLETVLFQAASPPEDLYAEPVARRSRQAQGPKPSRDSPPAPARPTPATATEPAADPPFDTAAAPVSTSTTHGRSRLRSCSHAGARTRSAGLLLGDNGRRASGTRSLSAGCAGKRVGLRFRLACRPPFPSRPRSRSRPGHGGSRGGT